MSILSQSSHPVHLAGHGAGSAIALTFARRYPQKRSLYHNLCLPHCCILCLSFALLCCLRS
ncbi:hypothetical protein [Nostoc sp.]|uniref:hypothetical protein n=1 Tax=Nostoc sp. TaxID=1180 RepID=UPI002FFCBE38